MLEESSLEPRFSKTFLVDLQISSELKEWFSFGWFCMFCLANILERVFEHFSHSSSLITMVQIFAPFDCLHSSWCNFSWKFSVFGLNSGKFLSVCLDQFSCKVQILEKDGACLFFLVQNFGYFNESVEEEWLLFTFLSRIFAYEEKICLPKQKFV